MQTFCLSIRFIFHACVFRWLNYSYERCKIYLQTLPCIPNHLLFAVLQQLIPFAHGGNEFFAHVKPWDELICGNKIFFSFTFKLLNPQQLKYRNLIVSNVSVVKCHCQHTRFHSEIPAILWILYEIQANCILSTSTNHSHVTANYSSASATIPTKTNSA